MTEPRVFAQWPGKPEGWLPGMGGGFVPFRRDVAYVAAQEASILPLLDDFEFVEDRQRWGYKFRFGLFDISDHDMPAASSAGLTILLPELRRASDLFSMKFRFCFR